MTYARNVPAHERAARIRGRKLQALRRRIAREQPLCPVCKANGRVVGWYEHGELDHIVGLAQGGTNRRENLQGLCKPCHAVKSTGAIVTNKPTIGLDGWPEEG